MNVPTIHKDFKLNGKSFESFDELLCSSEEISSEVYSFLKDWFNTANFVEVKTSGSTGKPKKIKLLKKAMQNSALATAQYFAIFNKTKALLCMPTKFIAGKMMLVRALELGWELDVVDPTSTPLKNINKTYDFSAMIPLQVQASINQLNQIEKLIIGGGVVSKVLLKKLQNIDCKCFATYGMTETVTHIAVKKLNNFVLEKNYKSANYKTLPNVKVTVDERNCLVISAPQILQHKITTNDVVELISSSEFKWVGRYDNVINSGGIKLFPEEIEQKISPYIKKRFFVSSLPNEKLGKELILIIEGSETNYKSILQQLKISELSKYQIPKKVFFIADFVETPNRKIQRKETLKLIKNTC